MTIASSASSSTFYPVFVAGVGSQAEYINTTNLQIVPSSGQITVGGNILPAVDNTNNLGSTTNRWANLYTGDINLSNEGGSGNEVDQTTGTWCIQEGKLDLYLINRFNGKRYKFLVEEI